MNTPVHPPPPPPGAAFKVQAVARVPGLRAGQLNTIDVLLRLQAPTEPAQPDSAHRAHTQNADTEPPHAMLATPLQRVRRRAGSLWDRFRPTPAVARACLHDLRLVLKVPHACGVEMISKLPKTTNGWQLADLAWGGEVWALLRLTLPACALPGVGQECTVLQASVCAQTLPLQEQEGESLWLQAAPLALPVLHWAQHQRLGENACVAQHLAELAAGNALPTAGSAAASRDRQRADSLTAAIHGKGTGADMVFSDTKALCTPADKSARAAAAQESASACARSTGCLTSRNERAARRAIATDSVPAYLRRHTVARQDAWRRPEAGASASLHERHPG